MLVVVVKSAQIVAMGDTTISVLFRVFFCGLRTLLLNLGLGSLLANHFQELEASFVPIGIFSNSFLSFAIVASTFHVQTLKRGVLTTL